MAAFPNQARQKLPDNPLIVSVTINDIIVDFLLALPGFEEQIIERTVQKEIDGKNMWSCSAENLINQESTMNLYNYFDII